MIAVIGGAGYIGSHTVKYLLEKGEGVVIFDKLSTGHREFVPYGIPFVEGDLSKKDEIEYLFKNYSDIHTVIHFAASSTVGESVKAPSKYYQNNVVNTINLLDCMINNEVKNIVFSSTCATYGVPQYLP